MKKNSLALEYKRKWQEALEAGEYEEALKFEEKYLVARLEVIKDVDSDVKRSKSREFTKVIYELKKEKPPVKIETGIEILDTNLVDEYNGVNKGGLVLGNFYIWTGVKGSGKTTLITRLIAGLTKGHKCNWFNFEMSKRKAYNMIKQFEEFANWKNLYYYDSDRSIDEVINEIKFNYSLGIKHFFIDSLMKIDSSIKDKVERYSDISNRLSALSAQLNINIHLIAQVSQETEKSGGFSVKYGNDIEYDADYMFILYKKPIKQGNKIVVDDFGNKQYDETKRILMCLKNRVDERLFSIELTKEDYSKDKEFKYEMQII